MATFTMLALAWGCGDGSPGRVVGPSSNKRPDTTPPTDMRSRSNLDDETPGGARGAPQEVDVATPFQSEGSTASQSSEGKQYWASDWCHYYDSQGTWYGDECIRPAADSAGKAIPDLFNVYRYPGLGRALGNAFEQISTEDPGHHEVRKLEDPLFNLVGWVRWPTGEQPEQGNTDFLVTDYLANQRVWMNSGALQRVIAAGQGPRYGFPGITTGANSFPIPDTSQWSSQNTTLGDWVAGIGGTLSRRTLEPNCTLPGVTCYRR